jgi:hypothetical protein
MTIKYKPSTIILPNITVEEVIKDENLIGYKLTANEGYVIYDTAANDVVPKTNLKTGEIIPVPIIYYFKEAVIPIRIPINNWTWVAVPESEVPADQTDK